jgi:class 3 adenylate cyclase
VAELTRRLAAVAFADVAGWSRLIEANDAATLHAWKALRSELIEPKINEHTGRLLEIAGDAVVVEFPSAVAAVSWAIGLQREIGGRNAGRTGISLTVRIGINVEDVIVDGDKVVGDGVNIAARIHQTAEPGEIIVTSTVRDYVLNKLPVAFDDLGMHELKNISRPIHLYRVETRVEAADARPRSVTAATFREPDFARDIRSMLAIDFEDSTASAPQNGERSSLRRRLAGQIENSILPIHGGQVAKAAEGALLLDFPRVPTAVRAAFEIQRACHEANAGMSSARQVLPRMALQIGEVAADYSGALGRGATVANRLTAIAGPGEIIVSAAVRDHLTPFLDADIEDLGECYLKQLPDPIRAYRVGPPGPRPVIEPGYGAADLRPTIAVIPFTARTSDPQHQVVGEVLADEVISALSRAAEMNVISRLSTTAFRGPTRARAK